MQPAGGWQRECTAMQTQKNMQRSQAWSEQSRDDAMICSPRGPWVLTNPSRRSPSSERANGVGKHAPLLGRETELGKGLEGHTREAVGSRNRGSSCGRAFERCSWARGHGGEHARTYIRACSSAELKSVSHPTFFSLQALHTTFAMAPRVLFVLTSANKTLTGKQTVRLVSLDVPWMKMSDLRSR